MYRQAGDAGLGPTIFFTEVDQTSPYWGLIVMEELSDGVFHQEFDSNNLSKSDMRALGHLFGRLHR